MTLGQDPLAERFDELDQLLAFAEQSLAGPALVTARQLVASVLAIHRESLADLLEGLRSLPNGEVLLGTLAVRPKVAGLLALHELHPEPLQARARRAIEAANVSAGRVGGAELLSVQDLSVRVLVRARTAAQATFTENLIESALLTLAPEASLEVERALSVQDDASSRLIPATSLRREAKKELA